MMDIQISYEGKIYHFKNGSEAFIFDIGTCHDMPNNQLIGFVSVVHECYLKDESDLPLGKFSDYVAMNWDRLKSLSPRTILCDFYNNNF